MTGSTRHETPADDWLERFRQQTKAEDERMGPDEPFEVTLTEEDDGPPPPPLPVPLPRPGERRRVSPPVPRSQPLPPPPPPEKRKVEGEARKQADRSSAFPVAFVSGTLLGLVLAGGGTLAYLATWPEPEPEPTPATPTPSPQVKAGPVAEVIVCERGTGQFTTLATALARAEAGQRIRVKPGHYRGSLVLDKAVQLVGDGPKDQIILESTGDAVVLKANAQLHGLTIRSRSGGSEKKGHAVLIGQGRPGVEGCDLSSDTLASVCVQGATTAPAFLRCRFHDGADGGLLVHTGARPVLSACRFEGNALAGIVVEKAGNPVVEGGTITANRADGILVRAGGAGRFHDCQVSDNVQAGVRIGKDSTPCLRQCKIHAGRNVGVWAEEGTGTLEGCEVFANRSSGVVIVRGANPVLVGCHIHGNDGNGVYASLKGEGVLLGCTIATKDRPAVVSREEASLCLRRCTLPGSATTASAVLVEVKGEGEMIDCTITGHKAAQVAVVKAGRLHLSRCTLRQGNSNGVYVEKDSTALLTGCTLEDYKFHAISARGGKAVLRQCTIRKCKDAAVVAHEGGTLHAVETEVHASEASAIVLLAAAPSLVDDCHLHDNAGAGVRVKDNSTATVRDCRLLNNRAGALDVHTGCTVKQSNNVTVP